MSTVAAPITADNLLQMPRGQCRYELIRGRLIETSPSGSEHGVVTMRLSLMVGQFVASRNLGLVFGAETGFFLERDPDTVRAPDIAFVRAERIPESGIPYGCWRGTPDLAVEVVSPNDTDRAGAQKAADWIQSGTRCVWIVDPMPKTVTVYDTAGTITTLAPEETLDGGEILTGFRCRVSDIFRVSGPV
jgi:Uma2 family endonuclease